MSDELNHKEIELIKEKTDSINQSLKNTKLAIFNEEDYSKLKKQDKIFIKNLQKLYFKKNKSNIYLYLNDINKEINSLTLIIEEKIALLTKQKNLQNKNINTAYYQSLFSFLLAEKESLNKLKAILQNYLTIMEKI